MPQPPSSTIEHHELTEPPAPHCAACDYDLRALPPDGVCPECGTPIADSARHDRLESSDPLFVNASAWGISFLIVASACAVGGIALTTLAGVNPTSIFWFRVGETVSGFRVFQVPGLWMLLTPVLPGRGDGNKWLARIGVVVLALRESRLLDNVMALFANEAAAWRFSSIGVGLLTAVMHVWIYFRLRELARRSDHRLEQHARMSMGLNLIFVGLFTVVPQFIRMPDVPTILLVVLPIAVTSYTVYVWWRFRMVLVTAAARARDNWKALQIR